MALPGVDRSFVGALDRPLPTETTADGAHQVDHTNVVLLLQSLYARVRQLPLGNDLAGQVVVRDALSYRYARWRRLRPRLGRSPLSLSLTNVGG